MIFNIVSGGLNLKDKNTLVSKESYALAMTNLACCVLLAVMLLPKCVKMMGKGSKVQGSQPKNMSMKYCMFLMCMIALNIGYSVMVYKYYDEKKQIDEAMYNFSIAVVVIDSVYVTYFMANYFGLVRGF